MFNGIRNSNEVRYGELHVARVLNHLSRRCDNARPSVGQRFREVCAVSEEHWTLGVTRIRQHIGADLSFQSLIQFFQQGHKLLFISWIDRNKFSCRKPVGILLQAAQEFRAITQMLERSCVALANVRNIGERFFSAYRDRTDVNFPSMLWVTTPYVTRIYPSPGPQSIADPSPWRRTECFTRMWGQGFKEKASRFG